MVQIQIRKLAKKEEGEKKGEEGLEGYTEISQDISNYDITDVTIKLDALYSFNYNYRQRET